MQPSLQIDIRQESSLNDFKSSGFRPILDAIDKLTQGDLSELFIVGPYGYGKTHLATAIYQHYTQTTQKTAISLSLADLIEQDPQASALIGLEMFDLIIIDDLQVIKRSYEWQEGLFHLINKMRDDKKQIIYFAEHPPRDLQIGLLDLATRLSLALLLNLPDNHDPQDRKLLVDTILYHKNWRLPDELLDYLVKEGPRNAGDIMTVLNHIAPLLQKNRQGRQTRVYWSKKTINEAIAIIEYETFLLEVIDHTNENF